MDAAPRKPPPSQASPRKLGVVGGRSTDKPSPSVEEAAAPEEEPVETKPQWKLGKIGGRARLWKSRHQHLKTMMKTKMMISTLALKQSQRKWVSLVARRVQERPVFLMRMLSRKTWT